MGDAPGTDVERSEFYSILGIEVMEDLEASGLQNSFNELWASGTELECLSILI